MIPKEKPSVAPDDRFEILRKGAVESLAHMIDVLHQLEDGNWFSETENYDATVRAVGVLAKAIQEATET